MSDVADILCTADPNDRSVRGPGGRGAIAPPYKSTNAPSSPPRGKKRQQASSALRGPSDDRVIALIDLDCFYASVSDRNLTLGVISYFDSTQSRVVNFQMSMYVPSVTQPYR